MPGNSFGKPFTVTACGESHGLASDLDEQFDNAAGNVAGFSLHAGVAVKARQRKKLGIYSPQRHRGHRESTYLRKTQEKSSKAVIDQAATTFLRNFFIRNLCALCASVVN
jgi:hypothetical protein